MPDPSEREMAWSMNGSKKMSGRKYNTYIN